MTRTVRDLAGGGLGRFEGTTFFGPLKGGGPPEDGGLLHQESGTFTRQGVPRPTERTLRFLPATGRGAHPGGAVDVRFDDGRPFRRLDLSAGRCVADHRCAADLYRGESTLLDEDHWRTVWRVRGPAKDLVLDTGYVRVG
ncbi:DUF6314 family protein [Streptomyces sp. KMM 9044]|uniref:DUF6314 family protein n=1 Tax=Streptomyces sp. KMM 9044 TaxID=2744474 RepID=UPI0021515F25|nr:DUF6314 family protein [Streptomyces sp. KMM 9044]WAX80966.1 DUF6314 family protein [Streptomyces sp. KMM 9044]